MKHDMMESEKDKNGKQSYDEMCSLGYGTSEKMCSSSNNATYRGGLFAGKKRKIGSRQQLCEVNVQIINKLSCKKYLIIVNSELQENTVISKILDNCH